MNHLKKIFCVALLIASFQTSIFSQVGEALNFDGSSDDVTIPTSDALNFPGGSFTYEVWARSATAGSWAQSGLISHRTASGDIKGLLPTGGSTKIGLWIENTNIQSPSISDIDEWHHYAGTYDGTTMRLYVDGAEVANLANSDGISSASQDIFIGRDNCCGSRYFSGDIDEVRIWNTARTATEISSNMNIELTGSETGLIAYYQFNEGIAGGDNPAVTNLPDIAGSNDGTLNNFSLTGYTSNWVGDQPIASLTTYYQDSDMDTYGNPDVSMMASSLPAGYVENADDCDDTNMNLNINPPVTSGDVCYETLEAAITANPSGPIQINADLTPSGDITIENGKTIEVTDGTCWTNMSTISNSGTIMLQGTGQFKNGADGIYQGSGTFIGDFINNGTINISGEEEEEEEQE